MNSADKTETETEIETTKYFQTEITLRQRCAECMDLLVDFNPPCEIFPAVATPAGALGESDHW